MTKSEGFSFDDWFDALNMSMLDLCGRELRDADSVREDYETDRNHSDVAAEVAAEYTD